MTRYIYFKPSGKWKYDGVGESIPLTSEVGYFELTRAYLLALNGGALPGLASGYLAEDLIIVIDDSDSFPRMLMPTKELL